MFWSFLSLCNFYLLLFRFLPLSLWGLQTYNRFLRTELFPLSTMDMLKFLLLKLQLHCVTSICYTSKLELPKEY